MNKEFCTIKLIEMFRQEENDPNGNLENVLDFILGLEQTGEYAQANICELKAMYYCRIDDIQSAYDWQKKLVALDPDDVGCWSCLAHYTMDLGNYKEAITYLSKAIELEKDKEWQPYTEGCIFFKAVCYYYLKDYAQCHYYLKDLADDYYTWVAGDLHYKKDMMTVLRGFGYY